MQIHISRNGAQIGIFSESEVRGKLASGEVFAADLAWHEGLSGWQPLGTLFPPPVTGASPFPAPPLGGAGFTPSSQRTSGTAIGSLVCGILGLLIFITSLPAVILGHISLSQIKKSGGALGGKGLAIAGLVMGYIVTGIFCLAVLAALLVPLFNTINKTADQTQALNHCRQIQQLLHAYAVDNNGLYPDSVPTGATDALPKTSNDAFRVLFQKDLIQDERIFGCKSSRFIPDNNIGTAPGFENALMPGENHWAMTGAASNTSSSISPLVFEAPIDPTWPPHWDADARGTPFRGRVWSDYTIIVGLNDGSARSVKLEGTTGHVTVKNFPSGKNTFTQGGETHPVVDIAAP